MKRTTVKKQTKIDESLDLNGKGLMEKISSTSAKRPRIRDKSKPA